MFNNINKPNFMLTIIGSTYKKVSFEIILLNDFLHRIPTHSTLEIFIVNIFQIFNSIVFVFSNCKLK
jgi:hypothetical protein